MSYNSEIVRIANEKLALRRDKNINAAELRKAEIYKKIPDYYELKKEMISLMGECISNLDKDGYNLNNLKSRLRDNAAKRENLLLSNGYPKDYTEEKFDCEKCSDKGYVGTEKCECLKQLLREIAAKSSNLNSVLSEDNFSNFRFDVFSDEKTSDGISPRENIKYILSDVKKFIDGFNDKYTKSLLFIGKSGVGKTYLASCIAKKLLDDGYDVYYQSAGKITEMAEDYRFKRNTSDELHNEIERLYETDLLIIDDLGCEFSNSYTISILYEIINKRLMYKKKMIITTNYSLKQLNDVYTERLFSRFLGEFNISEFIGDDLRVKNL